MNGKVEYRFTQLAIASEASVERLIPQHGADIKAVLREIVRKPTYTESEALCAAADLDAVFATLIKVIHTKGSRSAGEYGALDNVCFAAHEVRDILRDVAGDGLGGFAKGPLHSLTLQVDINERIEAANIIMNGVLARELGLDANSPKVRAMGMNDSHEEGGKKLAPLARRALSLVTEFLDAHQLSQDERVVLRSLAHVLGAAAKCDAPREVLLINPIAKAAAEALTAR